MAGRPSKISKCTTRKGAFALAVLAAALVSGCAGGGSPVSSLTEGDMSVRLAVRSQAMENNRTGEGINWHNPVTDSRGTVVPTRTFLSFDGLNCREFRETVTVGGDTDFLTGTFCRSPAGRWELVRAPERYRPGYSDFDDPYWQPGFRHGHFGYRAPPFYWN